MELKPAVTGAWAPAVCPKDIAPGSVRAILLFGPDQGGVHEFGRLAVTGEVERFDVSKTDPGEIASVLGSSSLFGGASSVILEGADDRSVKKLEQLLESPMEDEARIVVLAGDLKPASKLRKLFAARKDCVGAPLYALRDRDIQRYARDYFQGQSLKLGRDASDLVAGYLSGDRGAAARACEIVALHALGRGSATVEARDLRAVLDEVDEDADNAPLDHALSGDGGAAVVALNRRLASGESFVKLLRIFSSRAFRLRAMLETGLSPRDAVAKAKPPVFWAERDQVARMLSRLTIAKLDRMISMIDRVEYNIIENALPVDAALPAMLLDISRHGGWKDTA